jgi:DNA replication protein DnaC
MTDYPDQWAEVVDWLKSFRKYLSSSPFPELCGYGLVLTGPAGVGKTMLAAAILNYLHDKGFSTAYVRDGDLAVLLRRPLFSDEDSARLWLLERAACVVVDDALRQGGTSQTLEPFLRYRHDESKPTVITLNNEATLSPVLDSFLHDFRTVHFAGVDRRINPLEPTDARW